jgi:choline dehydrogenase-like flavoprotein
MPAQDPAEYGVSHYWLPMNDPEIPGAGQLVGSVHHDENGDFLGVTCGFSMYCRTEVRIENQLRFSDSHSDLLQMPRIEIDFSYNERDLAAIDQMRAVQTMLGQGVGEFDPARNSALLEPGSSLHFTGTVRMGTSPDGTSVCDPNGAVWGVDGLYVAGCGTIPTSISCNTTMTGMALTARVARGIIGRGLPT